MTRFKPHSAVWPWSRLHALTGAGIVVAAILVVLGAPNSAGAAPGTVAEGETGEAVGSWIGGSTTTGSSHGDRATTGSSLGDGEVPDAGPAEMLPAVGEAVGITLDPDQAYDPADIGQRSDAELEAPRVTSGAPGASLTGLELPGLLYTGCGGVNPPLVNDAWDQEVVVLTNSERLRNGSLPPLKRVSTLDSGARYHSGDMAADNYFQHDSYDRSLSGLTRSCGWVNRVSSYYPGYQALAENIAAGYISPSAVVAGWMASSGHRANILSTAVREIGAGFYCCSGSYTRYWTQDFGAKPGVYPLIINREAVATASTSVQLYIYGSFAEMRLRNDQGTWSAWRSFSNNVAWEIPPTAGTRTVSAEMRSGLTTYAASDTIQYTGSGAQAPTATTVRPTATRVGPSATATRALPSATATRTKTPLPTATGRTASPTPTKTRTPLPTATTKPTQAPLPTVVSGGQERSYTPSDDAFVFSSWPFSSFGRSTSLAIQSATGSQIRTYIKFQVSGLSVPPRLALLRLTVYDGGPSAGAVYLSPNVYRGTNTAWTESGLTWNNAPSVTSQALAVAGAVRAGEFVDYPVTAAVRGNGTYSFLVLTENADMVAFRAREFTSSPPRLVIKP